MVSWSVNEKSNVVPFHLHRVNISSFAEVKADRKNIEIEENLPKPPHELAVMVAQMSGALFVTDTLGKIGFLETMRILNEMRRIAERKR